jgi:hypothetical protein
VFGLSMLVAGAMVDRKGCPSGGLVSCIGITLILLPIGGRN